VFFSTCCWFWFVFGLGGDPFQKLGSGSVFPIPRPKTVSWGTPPFFSFFSGGGWGFFGVFFSPGKKRKGFKFLGVWFYPPKKKNLWGPSPPQKKGVLGFWGGKFWGPKFFFFCFNVFFLLFLWLEWGGAGGNFFFFLSPTLSFFPLFFSYCSLSKHFSPPPIFFCVGVGTNKPPFSYFWFILGPLKGGNLWGPGFGWGTQPPPSFFCLWDFFVFSRFGGGDFFFVLKVFFLKLVPFFFPPPPNMLGWPKVLLAESWGGGFWGWRF